MGVTRKLMALATFGLVDYRSDKERGARSARLTRRELRRIRRQTNPPKL